MELNSHYVMQGVLAASAIMLEGTAGIEEHIVQRMLAMSASWKRRVLSIAATYRMTSRPPPSKPSHYVASLLEGPMVRTDQQGLFIGHFADSLICRGFIITSLQPIMAVWCGSSNAIRHMISVDAFYS